MATLLALALFAALVVACAGVGGLLLRRVRPSLLPIEGGVFAVTLGMGMIGYAVLALGLLRLLQPGVLGGLLALLSLAGAVLLVKNRRKEEKKEAKPAGFLGLACALGLGILGLCTIIAALAPPGGLEWDSLSYHLAVPKTYLREGRIFFIPYDHHSNFPFALQMLYTLMLGLGSIGAAKLCHWLCGVLIVVSVYTFAARHFSPAETGRKIGLVAALLVASTPIVLWEASVAYVDLATALFTWLSLYALVNAATLTPLAPTEDKRDGLSVSWLLVSAVLMGFALGTKYTVIAFWGMLLVGVLGWHYATTRRWAKETIPHAALWGAVSMLVGAPWYIKSWLYTGSPVYPFFYNLFGGRYWNAQNAAQYSADQDAFGLGKTPVHLLLGPWNATMEAALLPSVGRPFIFTEYVLFGLSPAVLALVLGAPLLTRRFSRATVYCALFGGGVFFFWFFLMQQTRYLIVGLPALALVGAEALVRAREERALRLAPVLGAGLVAASTLWGMYLAAQQLAAPAVPVVFGQTAPLDWVTGSGGGMRGLIPSIRHINENAPKDAKVSLFNEPRGFWLEREYAWGEGAHAHGLFPWSQYTGVDDWLTDFRRRGYTYLLVGPGGQDADPEKEPFRRLLPEALASDKVEIVFQERGYTVYRLP